MLPVQEIGKRSTEGNLDGGLSWRTLRHGVRAPLWAGAAAKAKAKGRSFAGISRLVLGPGQGRGGPMVSALGLPAREKAACRCLYKAGPRVQLTAANTTVPRGGLL